jgi:endonuclease III-like uncharacterized protein
MRASVYLKTTISSYLTAWRSLELIMAANQQATRDWWDNARPNYDLFISDVVKQEAAEGNKDAALRRFKSIADIPELALSVEAEQLAGLLLSRAALPQKA